jgi:hypothetical protein
MEHDLVRIAFVMCLHHVSLNGYRKFFYSNIIIDSEHVGQHVFVMENLLCSELLGKNVTVYPSGVDPFERDEL